MHRYTGMRVSLFNFLIFVGLIGQGQVVTQSDASKKAMKNMDAGVELAMAQQFEEALKYMEKAIDAEPNFITARIFAGDICTELQRFPEAKEWFQSAIDLQDDYDIGVYKKIAVVEQRLMLYDEAIDHIDIFLEHPRITGKTKENAERIKKSLLFAIDAVKKPLDFKPENMGVVVNSKYDEYFPSISADRSVLVFTRNLMDTFETESGTVIVKGNEDFFISAADGNSWKSAYNIGKPVNSKLNEGAQNISANGRWLFFTLCNGPMGYGSCDIYYAYRFDDVWSNPENCGKRINTANWDSQPSVSADGKSLFFVSNRPGGYGGADIWMSTMGSDGYWESAVNLGPEINTDGEESSPFIHPDGTTLYFASDGHAGMGGSDLFFARKSFDGNWEQPVNLGYPLNTSGNEATLHVSTDGLTAYYSSDREDSYGGLDLYSFPLPDILKPDPVTYVKAIVKDANTLKPVEADIQLFSLAENELIANSKSGTKDGQFLVTLPSGKDYGLYVNKDGYLFNSVNFSLEAGIPEKPYILEILLKPVSIGQVITLENLFFESGSAEILPESASELEKVKVLLENNPTMSIVINGHTDNIGTEEDNQALSEKRAKAVANQLTAQGISTNRIEWKGLGESQPIADNATDSGRKINRRTELEILGL